MRLVERIVGVDASLTETWQALIKAEDWPNWMPVRSVEASPPGKVDKSTSAGIRGIVRIQLRAKSSMRASCGFACLSRKGFARLPGRLGGIGLSC